MGESYPFFKKEIAEYLKSKFNRDASILDVGAGSGTYWHYLHDYFENMYAIEVYKPNIDNFLLEMKYKKVYNQDIRDSEYKNYDIIIFGDILEHLEVEDAKKVLNYALERCKEVVVALPYMYEQGALGGNDYERHKQPDLTPEKVLQRYPKLKLLYGNDRYGYYVKKES